MNANPRLHCFLRRLGIGAGILVLGSLFFCEGVLAPRCETAAYIAITPFTNEVLRAPFQRSSFASISNVRVKRCGVPSQIRIEARAATFQQSRRAAAQAMSAFGAAALKEYGAKTEVVDIVDRLLRPFPRVMEGLDRLMQPLLKHLRLI